MYQVFIYFKNAKCQKRRREARLMSKYIAEKAHHAPAKIDDAGLFSMAAFTMVAVQCSRRAAYDL